jgi:hypothetical protein
VGDVREAALDVGIQDILLLAHSGGHEGTDRIMADSPWPKAVAVGLKARFPFRLQHQRDQSLVCPIEHDGNAQRPLLRRTRLGDPHPPCGLEVDLFWMAQAGHEVRSLRRRDRLDPIDTRGPLPLIVLRHPSHGERAGGPRLQEETLQAVDCLDVATAGGSIDPSLQAEYRPLQLPPGDGAPVFDGRMPRPRFRFVPRLQP